MDGKIILSWDVGIKNLAYCILHKKSIDDFTIRKWGVINLVDDRSLCCYQLKNKKLCGKIAKYNSKSDENENINTCKSHKDNYIPDIINNIDLQCEKCNSKSIKSDEFGKIGWCEKHLDKLSKSFLHKYKPKKLTGQDCKDQLPQDLATKMYTVLDGIPELLNVEEVLIENQPSLMNPMMKTVSSILFSYFIMRGIIDNLKNKSLIKIVRFVSPSNKLKVNKKNTENKLSKAESKKGEYKITKGLGETYCKALISKDDLKILETYKKKDDMCDAFLQGFQYLFSPVPDKLFNLIDNIPEPKKKEKKTKKIKVDK
jgi:hypothetical protein